MRQRDRLEVLVVSYQGAKPPAAGPPGGDLDAALAEHGIHVRRSATLPRWILPRRTGRAAGPIRRAVGIVAGSVKRTVQLFYLPGYDTVVVRNALLGDKGPPLFERLFAERAVFYVFELDDSVGAPAQARTSAGSPARAEVVASLADRVIARDDAQAEWAGQFCDDLFVVPAEAETAVYAEAITPPAERRGSPAVSWRRLGRPRGITTGGDER